jgi:predicted negative regulator of RcsB-dependent stress response
MFSLTALRSFATKNLIWIILGSGLAIALAVAWFYVSSLHSKLDAAKASLVIQTGETIKAVDTANNNADEIIRAKVESRRATRIVLRQRDEAVAREVAARKREREILNAPRGTDDGCFSDILTATLQRLRDEANTGNNGD